MDKFVLFAKPWWVNLLILVPLGLFYFWRKQKLNLSQQQLLVAGIFGIAFGLVEASVVVYLRAALGVLPGYQMLDVIQSLPKDLLRIEIYREAATIVMLWGVAFLTAKRIKERWAVFLWAFAAWDILFYVFLWLFIRWPGSLTTTDILFLIPVPWVAQVWYPLLVSSLTATVIYVCSSKRHSSTL